MGYDKLIKAGLKTTVQRAAILDYMEKTTEHPSAEMVYKEINKKYPSITLSTIYNTLETFVEKKIITKVFSLDGKARYDARMEKHHHLFDKKTGEIVDVFDENLNHIMNDYLKKYSKKDVEIDDFHIDFTGRINKKINNNNN